jgi:hypothetical protein
MPRRGRLVGALVAILFVLACVSRQSFMPTERLTAFSPQGFIAAEYDLKTRLGDLGQARVWSQGGEYVRFRGQRRTLLHIGLEIENQSEVTLVLDQQRLRLDSATVNGTTFENIQVASIRGDTVIPPGEERRIDVHFALTPGVYPTDVRAFRLRWALRDNGAIYAQRTPFIQPPVARGPAYWYHTPFYDPFFYGGWGWGYGWSWGWPRGVIMHPYPYYHYRMY